MSPISTSRPLNWSVAVPSFQSPPPSLPLAKQRFQRVALLIFKTSLLAGWKQRTGVSGLRWWWAGQEGSGSSSVLPPAVSPLSARSPPSALRPGHAGKDATPTLVSAWSPDLAFDLAAVRAATGMLRVSWTVTRARRKGSDWALNFSQYLLSFLALPVLQLLFFFPLLLNSVRGHLCLDATSHCRWISEIPTCPSCKPPI